MATPIKPIPILTGQIARKFNKLADYNLANRKAIDRTKERESLKAILKKAKL